MMALYQPSTPKTTQTIAVPKESVAQTVLSFGTPSVATSSSVLRQPADLNYSLPINISTGKNNVNAIQLELQYDPKILTNISLVPGPFFPSPEILLNQIDFKTGRISYAFGVGITAKGVVGEGVAATLNFSVSSSAEPTAILFLPKTLVTDENFAESVLKETSNFQLVIKQSGSAPSPSPTVKPSQ